MASRYIVIVLSLTILVYMFKAVQGGSNTPPTTTGNGYDRLINDIIKEAKDDRKKVVENFSKWIEDHKDDRKKVVKNFSKWIEDHKDDLEKGSTLHLEKEASKNSSSKIRNMFEELIKKALRINSKNYTAIFPALTSNEDQSVSDSSESIQQDLYNDKSKDQSVDNNCQEREESESNIQDTSNESSDSREDYRRVDSVMHDIIGTLRDLRSRTVERVLKDQHFVKSQLRTKFDMLSQVLALDNDDSEESNDKDHGDAWEMTSAKTTPEEINKITKFIKAELGRIQDKHKDTKTVDYSALVNRIWEIIGPDIKNLQFSKQAFIDTKTEMVEAAKKLHETYRPDYKHPRGSSESRTFDFKSLISFKSKIAEMILKKKEYINQKDLLKRKIKETVKKVFLTYPRTTVSSSTFSSKDFKNTSMDLFTFTPGYVGHTNQNTKVASTSSVTNFDPNHESKVTANKTSTNKNVDGDENSKTFEQTTEQSDISFNISINSSQRGELKLAAGFTANKDVDEDGDGSIVVVVVVLACLIISAIIGVLSVVMWRKYHSHRLYVRIPNGSSTTISERRSIW